ncbi:SOS response-associated peptidase [Aureispira sp. CCB-E]|uniref:SOS response-associated peptidase n=1 Tax=Aureispira sp. CCB-E TaxID=3051121 RepID=UPI002868CB1D|nr:SOS response-associated peptidase [Aureispira sp. CCB-E]WMX15046.1 SOS response-associated peptidase [Aureispira sp. CCB-E]
MPTRFSFSASKEKMKRQFNLDIKKELQQSFNIGATQNAYLLTNQSLDLQIFSWGLIPHWAKDKSVGTNLINAQVEGIASKLSFRLPIRQRRCLIFADSYYEWTKEGRATQPYRVQLSNGDLMTFAGVWDVWVDGNQGLHKTFSIITTPANNSLKELGISRMPALITTGTDRAKWLGEHSLPNALNILQPLENLSLDIYPIAKEVDSLDNNYPELHKPIELSS